MQQYNFDLPPVSRMTVEDFIVTSSNVQAWRWLIENRPDQWPSHYFILHGPKGCGKTHLVNIWAEKYEAIRLKGGEDILTKILDNAAQFKAFCLDDGERLANNPELETWVQHFFNLTKNANLPVVVTSRMPVKDWPLKLADVRSRLLGAMSVEMCEPDDELLKGLILKQFFDRQLRISAEVLDYILRNIPRSAADVINFVERTDEISLAERRNITIPLVKKTIEDINMKIISD